MKVCNVHICVTVKVYSGIYADGNCFLSPKVTTSVTWLICSACLSTVRSILPHFTSFSRNFNFLTAPTEKTREEKKILFHLIELYLLLCARCHMFPVFILLNSTPGVCFIRASGQCSGALLPPLEENRRRWWGIYFPSSVLISWHPPFAHTKLNTDCPQANRKYVFCMGEDKNTCTDDTPLGRRKQKVPQTTDETGNIAAILSNRPTVRQISTSAGLILIALCTACASWIEYCQELETGMDRAEQVDIVGFD